MPKKGTRTPSGGYSQNWPAYHASQVNEKPHFLRILSELCKEIADPKYVKGRPPLPLRDVIFCLLLKVYSTFSSRRASGDLCAAKMAGLISVVPKANTVSAYLRKKALTAVLCVILTKSSLPLARTEKIFAADSSGFSVPRRRTWFNRHTRRRMKRRDFAKLHIMCGTTTNVITCAIPSEGTASDRNYLKELIAVTARYFKISEVSADAGYMSGANMREVLLVGALPYIAFSKRCALDADYKSRIWKDLLYLFKTKDPVFTRHYYLRNNVEATFHAMKARFRDRLRSKSTCGQFNEMLCVAICHNLCVLIRAMFEMKVDPLSWGKIKPRRKVDPRVALSRRKKELVEIRRAAAGREALTQQEPLWGPEEGEERKAGKHGPGRKSSSD